MLYSSAELISRLAAEYVIGTLRGPARRRFERLLHSSAEAQREVRLWEQELGGHACCEVPIAPPAECRQQLLRSIRPASTPRRRTARSAFWLGAAAAAITAAVWLRAGDGLPGSALPLAARQLALRDLYPQAPIYLTRVGIPSSSMQWLVSMSADHRHLVVVAGGDFFQVGRHTLELWYQQQAGGSPLPLGALPVENGATVSFDLPRGARRDLPLTFVLSLEPESGRSSQPRGPVLDAQSALDSI